MRKINFETEKYFECQGKKFFVTNSLGFARYRILQKISLEFGFSSSFEDIYNNQLKLVEYYNKHDYFNMSIVVYKNLEGIKNIEEKDDPAFRLCALFINEEGEDPTIYNEAMMKAKIDCWAKELEVSPFFYLAVSLVPAWMPAYQLLIRSGSKEEKEPIS
jgi:hypothetical protein